MARLTAALEATCLEPDEMGRFASSVLEPKRIGKLRVGSREFDPVNVGYATDTGVLYDTSLPTTETPVTAAPSTRKLAIPTGIGGTTVRTNAGSWSNT